MAILNGCQEGKATPKLMEVACPKCGEVMEIFVRMGGQAGATGTIVEKAVCSCGFEAEEGTPADRFKPC